MSVKSHRGLDVRGPERRKEPKSRTSRNCAELTNSPSSTPGLKALAPGPCRARPAGLVRNPWVTLKMSSCTRAACSDLSGLLQTGYGQQTGHRIPCNTPSTIPYVGLASKASFSTTNKPTLLTEPTPSGGAKLRPDKKNPEPTPVPGIIKNVIKP